MSYNKLSEAEKQVIDDKKTESPFTGEYDNFFSDGTYICRKCNQQLFSSQAKFDAGCGWPAFDEFFAHSVNQLPDSDGRRTEIVCSNCGGHLGHVFVGEKLTDKNSRHCVNPVSIRFISKGSTIPPTLYGK